MQWPHNKGHHADESHAEKHQGGHPIESQTGLPRLSWEIRRQRMGSKRGGADQCDLLPLMFSTGLQIQYLSPDCHQIEQC